MTLKLQNHHIIYDEPEQDCYDDDECPTCGHVRQKEWTVALPWSFHRPMIVLQRWKPTHERYALVINWVHAILYECNKMRMKLDQMEKDEEE